MPKAKSTIRLHEVPAWLPEPLKSALPAGQRFVFDLSRAERSVLRRRKWMRPSQWVEANRYVRMSSMPGRWRNIFTPYLVGIMDAARYPGVETVILCKTPQTGGSEAGMNILAHMIDLAPGPAMIVFPDELTARENVRDRLLPMLEDSPRLRARMGRLPEDSSNTRINLQHMPIYVGWSGSVARLGNKPIRTLILDELDKYQNPKKEASSEDLAEKRTTTWKRRKMILKISTPTTETGPIWKAYTQEAHARFAYQVVCPICGTAQRMIFDQIRWPEDERDPEKVLGGTLAWYECPHCAAHWIDADRDRAVRAGNWVEEESGRELFAYLESNHPVKIGFHIPSWISYFVSLSEVAHAFLRYEKSKRLEDLKNFMNQYKAEPWREQYAVREEDSILALCDNRPRGIVPGPVDGAPRVAALVAGVDTQASYFRYVIRAWGFGPQEESWLVQCGSVPNFEALDQLLWRNTYIDGAGEKHRVRACVIDAMGAPGRTRQVYAWCAKNGPRAMAYKGERTLSTPVSYSPQEFFPDAKGTKIRIPGGVLLRRVDTTFFKGDLAEKLRIAPGDPGTFWLHANHTENWLSTKLAEKGHEQAVAALKNAGSLTEYAREMCAEVFNPETLAWDNPHQRPNHFWDCEVMSLVCAWELGVRNWQVPAEKKKEQTRPQCPARSASAADRLARLRRR